MNVKLIEVLKAKEALSKLSQEKLPVKISYKLSRLVKELETEFATIESFKMTLAQKYGKETEGQQGQWEIPAENIVSFNAEFSELLEEDIELKSDIIECSLSAIDSISLSTSDILSIEEFVSFVV